MVVRSLEEEQLIEDTRDLQVWSLASLLDLAPLSREPPEPHLSRVWGLGAKVLSPASTSVDRTIFMR